MGRFDYVKYDEDTAADQLTLKEACEHLESLLVQLPESRSRQLALTKLEECYMWTGKALRDRQLADNESAQLTQEIHRVYEKKSPAPF